MRIFYRYVKTPYKTIITNNFEGRFTTRCHLRYFSFTAVSGIPERFYVTEHSQECFRLPCISHFFLLLPGVSRFIGRIKLSMHRKFFNNST